MADDIKLWSYGTNEENMYGSCDSRECAILCGFGENPDTETLYIASHVPNSQPFLLGTDSAGIEEKIQHFAERCYLNEYTSERLINADQIELGKKLQPLFSKIEDVFRHWLEKNAIEPLEWSDEEEVQRYEYERLLLNLAHRNQKTKTKLELVKFALEGQDFKRAESLVDEISNDLNQEFRGCLDCDNSGFLPREPFQTERKPCNNPIHKPTL